MMTTLLWILIAIAVVSLVSLLLSRLSGLTNLLAIVLLVLVVTFYLVFTEFRTTQGAFVFLKFLTLAFSALVVAAFRFSREPPGWTRVVLYLILLFNILEAVGFEAFDISIGGTQRSSGGSVPNVLAGLALLFCQAGPAAIQRNSRSHVHYDLGVLWIVLYVLWNFTFVYGTNPPDRPTGEYSGVAVIHLVVPLLLMGRRGLLFAEMRLYSLFLVMAILLVVPFAPFVRATPEWYARTIADGLGWLNLVLALVLIVRQAYTHGHVGQNASALQVVLRSFRGARRRLP